MLKKLAPPLLKEFEGLRGVKPGHDPFTPRRTTRSVCASSSRKTKASAAETVLLRTLSLDCDDLAVSEDALGQLRTVFDSPLQEPQLRAIAAIFGKAIPLNLSEEAGMAEPILAQYARWCRWCWRHLVPMSFNALELVCWNVRGLNSPAKKKRLGSLLTRCTWLSYVSYSLNWRGWINSL